MSLLYLWQNRHPAHCASLPTVDRPLVCHLRHRHTVTAKEEENIPNGAGILLAATSWG